MTPEERYQYDKLSYDAQRIYDFTQQKHMNWNHDQIMTKVGVELKIEVMIDNGRDVDSDDPVILKEILEGAKSVLIEAGIFIAAVFEWLDNAISSLGDMILSGVSWIGNKLSEFWDWLTDE